MPTTHCDCGTSATLPFGVFQTNNNRFFGSVRISGQTKFLGNFASANDAAGYFSIQYGSPRHTTAAIAHNASAAEVQLALNNLRNLGDVEVSEIGRAHV